jgi:DNA-binding CsgD family transcriptional regulator
METIGVDVFGREAEFEVLAGFVGSQADAGSLLIEGEPGIGKTTLWRAAVAHAAGLDRRVLSSSPASAESQLSFAGLDDLLAGALPDVAADLPIPQVRALQLALLLDDAGDEQVQPRTVLAATLSTLRALADLGPVLIAIDDVQWLDTASVEALAFALRRLGDARVSFLGSVRLGDASEQQRALVQALEHRDGHAVRRIVLGPLSMSATHDAVVRRFGLSPAPSVMERIHETSGGNPFYALELTHAVVRRAVPLEPGGTLPVPETLHQVVGLRLDALSTDAQQLLGAAALISHPTRATLEAVGTSVALDEGIDAGLVEESAHGQIRFVHALFASAAAARLTAAQRRVIHRRLADVLEGEQRARHLALGASGPAHDIADELHAAVGEAAGRGAIGAAVELAEQALRLTPAEPSEVRQRRQLETATLELRHGDTELARTHLDPLLAELPAGPMRAGVLLQLARLHEAEAVVALELCEQAIAEAGPADANAAAAHQLLAEMSMLSGNVPNALEHARLAAATAEKAGDWALLIESLGTLCHYQTYTGTVEAGLLERAVELEREHARPSNNYSPREILGLRLMYADRLDEARVLLEASLETATDIGDGLDRGSLLVHLSQLECRAGRLAIAQRHARDVTVLKEQAGWGLQSARFASALVNAHIGQVAAARRDGEDGASRAAAGGSEVFRVLNEWALGFLELSRGDAAAAHRHLRPLPAIVDGMGYANPGVRPVHADAIEAAIGAGDLDMDDLIDDLERRGRSFGHPTARAAAARCRGLLLAARGAIDDAVTELSRAVTEAEESPQPLERARTRLALGSALRRAKHRREARESLTQALEMFDNIGTPLWAERAAAELERIPGRTSSRETLTPTERRVAQLVADGLSNKEVASALFVSVRSVEDNLSSVYAKLGLRSRSELARRMGDQQT